MGPTIGRMEIMEVGMNIGLVGRSEISGLTIITSLPTGLGGAATIEILIIPTILTATGGLKIKLNHFNLKKYKTGQTECDNCDLKFKSFKN